MAHFSAAAAVMGQLDQSYDLFSQLSHPGSTSMAPFYNLMQQNAMPPHQTSTPPTTLPWNAQLPFQQVPQAGPSQYDSMMMNMGTLQFQGHSDMTLGTTSQQSPPQGAMGHPLVPPEVDLEEAEEKRRRNTAASGKIY
jgi:hypothetical protein